jgi:hypothetical protein
MFQALSQDTERHRLHLRTGVGSRIPVSHDAGQTWHLRQPPAIGFLVKLDT